MAIPKQRDWRADWDADDWWWHWPFMWLVVGCAAEARRRVDSREQFARAYDEMLEYRNNLVRTETSIIARRGERDESISTRAQLDVLPHLILLDELRSEIHRCDDERIAMKRAHEDRAFDEDSIELATLRELLERRVPPYQFAKWTNRGLDSSDIANTSEKRTAQKLRTDLRNYYERLKTHWQQTLNRPGRTPAAWDSELREKISIAEEMIDRLSARAGNGK